MTSATVGVEAERAQLDWIAGQLLFAWLRNDGSLSDEAFAEVLRRGEEEVRLEVLSLGRSIMEEPYEEAVRDRIEGLIEVVWPRQAALRSASVVIRLVDLALAGRDRTSRLREIVMPHLIQLPDWPEMYRFHDLEASARSHPQEVLELLDRICPSVAISPVYGLDDVVGAITENHPELDGDLRLEKLRRAGGVRD